MQKDIPKNFAELTENTCVGVFFNKKETQACNLIKKETSTQVFSCEHQFHRTAPGDWFFSFLTEWRKFNNNNNKNNNNNNNNNMNSNNNNNDNNNNQICSYFQSAVQKRD